MTTQTTLSEAKQAWRKVVPQSFSSTTASLNKDGHPKRHTHATCNSGGWHPRRVPWLTLSPSMTTNGLLSSVHPSHGCPLSCRIVYADMIRCVWIESHFVSWWKYSFPGELVAPVVHWAGSDTTADAITDDASTTCLLRGQSVCHLLSHMI